jgi:hypothetical protein
MQGKNRSSVHRMRCLQSRTCESPPSRMISFDYRGSSAISLGLLGLTIRQSFLLVRRPNREFGKKKTVICWKRRRAAGIPCSSNWRPPRLQTCVATSIALSVANDTSEAGRAARLSSPVLPASFKGIYFAFEKATEADSASTVLWNAATLFL